MHIRGANELVSNHSRWLYLYPASVLRRDFFKSINGNRASPLDNLNAGVNTFVVEGTFETYREDGDNNLYCRLKDATLEVRDN